MGLRSGYDIKVFDLCHASVLELDMMSEFEMKALMSLREGQHSWNKGAGPQVIYLLGRFRT